MAGEGDVHNEVSGVVLGDVVQAGVVVVTGSSQPDPGPVGWPVRDVTDPLAFEVHPAIDSGADSDVLPLYVGRAHDALLREQVLRAVAGTSAIVVLVGGSSTGKTRACWEALRFVPDDWRLWHPIDPQAVVAGVDRVAPRTVVWLNESHHYLGAPVLGERVAAGLRELLRRPDRGPVLVLGTVWPEHWAALTAEENKQGRSLLTGADVRVPESFTGAAVDAVRRAAVDDPRFREAVAQVTDGRITQFLAGVPALLDRYRNATAGPRALIEAAMDARRLGHGPALPRALLEAAAPGYLSDDEWESLDDDWVEQALTYAGARCRGVRGPITRIRPRPGEQAAEPRYRLADYLEQVGRTRRANVLVPASLWDALPAHASRESLSALARAAESRRLDRHAYLLHDTAGDLEGMARFLESRGRKREAVDWLRGRDEPAALYLAAGIYESFIMSGFDHGSDIEWNPWDDGYPDVALEHYCRAAAAGHVDSVSEAVRVLRESGLCDRPAEVAKVVEVLEPWESSEDTDVLEALVELYEYAGRDEAAAELQRRIDADYHRFRTGGETTTARELARLRPAADAGDPGALQELVSLLRQPGVRAPDEIRYFQRAAEAGDARAWGDAAWRLRNERRLGEAITWLVNAAEAGHTGAHYSAAQMLEQNNDRPAAIEHYRKAAAAGDSRGQDQFARLSLDHARALDKAGDLDGAVRHARTAAEAGERFAWSATARYLAEAGRADEAREWLRRNAEAGNVDAVQQLAWHAVRAPDLVLAEEALALLRAHADAGDQSALAATFPLFLALHRFEEAFAAELRATEAGCADVLDEIHLLDLPQRFAAELERLRKHGLEPGGKVSPGWSPPERA